MRNALLIVTCLALFGCNKSERASVESEQPAVPPIAITQPKPIEDGRKIIVAFGDSLSEGYGADPGKSYPDYLQSELDRAGYRYRVVNQGISGDTTTGGLGRIQSAVALRPELVILELGGNDGLRGIPVTSSRENLERMILALKNAETQVVLAGMTLPPNYGTEYIAQFEGMYADLAKKHHVTFLPFLLEDIRRVLPTQPGLMQRDGIHPTGEGNRIVAAAVFRGIRPLLRRP